MKFENLQALYDEANSIYDENGNVKPDAETPYKWWSDGSGYIELVIHEDDARQGHHQGACDDDIADLMTADYIKMQFDALTPENVVKALYDYSDWDLTDHDTNLSRLLWIACGDIVDAD